MTLCFFRSMTMRFRYMTNRTMPFQLLPLPVCGS
jgi:hypothetical protein